MITDFHFIIGTYFEFLHVMFLNSCVKIKKCCHFSCDFIGVEEHHPPKK